MTTERLRYELRYYRDVRIYIVLKSTIQPYDTFNVFAKHPDGTVFRHTCSVASLKSEPFVVEQTNRRLFEACKKYEVLHPIADYGWEQFYKSI